jgi:phage protein D
VQLTPSAEPGASTLSVTGKDVSQMLDLEEKNEAFPNQPDYVIAATIIGSYAQYGLMPATAPTTDVPIEVQRTPRQAETDLRCLQRLAQRNGYVFYVEPVTFGVNTAYWGPENRLSEPQPALTIGMGAQNNVKGLHFSYDGLAPVGTKVTIIEPTSGMTIPIPPLPALKVPPLALNPTVPRRVTLARDAAQQSAAQGAGTALSSAMNAADSVTAQGEVDAARYGHALRARKLVGVRGAGLTYDGLYFVRQVTHTIVPGTSYTQSFSLSREGTTSTLPAVPL